MNSDGAATRQAILQAAWVAFAEFGYQATTYRTLHERTGLSAPTVYHYFPSKLELYQAVYDDVHREIHDVWLLPCIDDPTDRDMTFHEQVDRFLGTVQEMNRARPILARFVAGARVDVARHVELAPLAASARRRRVTLFGKMADSGIRRGEIRREDRAVTIEVLDVISAGLSAVASRSGRHDRAAAGLSRFLAGELVTPVEGDDAGRHPVPPVRARPVSA